MDTNVKTLLDMVQKGAGSGQLGEQFNVNSQGKIILRTIGDAGKEQERK
jgi:hypothetical protein